MSQLQLHFSKKMQKNNLPKHFPARSERVTKKKINISKVLKTAAGYPVRNLHLSVVQSKKSLQHIDYIVGQVLYYDELVRAKVWVNESWFTNGFHRDDYEDFDLVEVIKSDGIENQLHIF